MFLLHTLGKHVESRMKVCIIVKINRVNVLCLTFVFRLSLFLFFMFNENPFSWYVVFWWCICISYPDVKTYVLTIAPKTTCTYVRFCIITCQSLYNFPHLLAAKQPLSQLHCRFLSRAVLGNLLLYCEESKRSLQFFSSICAWCCKL